MLDVMLALMASHLQAWYERAVADSHRANADEKARIQRIEGQMQRIHSLEFVRRRAIHFAADAALARNAAAFARSSSRA